MLQARHQVRRCAQRFTRLLHEVDPGDELAEERLLGLPRQVRAHAEVLADAEGQVRARVAVDAKLVRRLEEDRAFKLRFGTTSEYGRYGNFPATGGEAKQARRSGEVECRAKRLCPPGVSGRNSLPLRLAWRHLPRRGVQRGLVRRTARKLARLLRAAAIAMAPFAIAGAGLAAPIDFRSGSGSTFDNGEGVTFTVSAWGGAVDPQLLIDPRDPGASGLQNLGTNIGGSAALGTAGIGCGTGECDLSLPDGEDALLFSFNQLVAFSIIGAALDDVDDVSMWTWADLQNTWSLEPVDPCGSGCSGEQRLPLVSITRYLLIVAEDSGPTSFRIAEINVTGLPEPALVSMLAVGLLVVLLRD